MAITINLDKAKKIAHHKRRKRREYDMKPHDEVVMLNYDADASATAETARAAIRTANATIQANIDAATDVDALQTIVTDLNIKDLKKSALE